MEKTLLKLWAFCKSRFLQIILGFIAYASWIKASEPVGGFGESTESGYMGLITCACIFGIVYLEVNKSKLHK